MLQIEFLKEMTGPSENRKQLISTPGCFVVRGDKFPLIPCIFAHPLVASHAFLRQLANGLCGHKIEISKLFSQGLNL